jgi:hypothetical protein
MRSGLSRRAAAILESGGAPPLVAAAVVFAILFWLPLTSLVRDWLTNPEAAHGFWWGRWR